MPKPATGVERPCTPTRLEDAVLVLVLRNTSVAVEFPLTRMSWARAASGMRRPRANFFMELLRLGMAGNLRSVSVGCETGRKCVMLPEIFFCKTCLSAGWGREGAAPVGAGPGFLKLAFLCFIQCAAGPAPRGGTTR